MIITFFINVLLNIFNVLVSWLPQVTTLPIIFGFDIDGAMVTGMSQFNQLVNSVWVLSYMFQGFLAIVAYYIIKITIKIILGSRTPTHN